MSYQELAGIHVSLSEGVATVTIDNPPLNLADATLLPSLRTFIARVRHDSDVRVIVFDSADPDFFIAHGDMGFIIDPQTAVEAAGAAIAAVPDAAVPPTMNLMQVVHEELRSLPQVTIGKLAGLARGGGNEFLMSLDMRFAAVGKSGQAQPETLMGIIPGGGGTQYLTRLTGRLEPWNSSSAANSSTPNSPRPTGWSTGPYRPTNSTTSSTLWPDASRDWFRRSWPRSRLPSTSRPGRSRRKG